MLRDPGTTKTGIALFEFTDQRDQLRLRSFGSRLARWGWEEYRSRYLRSLSPRWNRSRVAGRRMIAVRRSRRGLRNDEPKPKSRRSAGEKRGARCRLRLRTRSWCLSRRFSASTALAPPVPKSLTPRLRRCTSKIRMALIRQHLASLKFCGKSRP